MEIITFVRRGAITHRDDLGDRGRTEAGDVQVMPAGTGITPAEYNLDPPGPPRRCPRAGGENSTVPASGRAADEGSGLLPLNADAAVLVETAAE